MTETEAVVSEWHELLARYAKVSCAIERALQDSHGIGVSEFEALERLATCGKEKLRAAELTETLHLSQSAASRLVSRLERHDLVSRTMCPQDRRGIFVCLTTAGRDLYLAARPVQRAVLAEKLVPAASH